MSSLGLLVTLVSEKSSNILIQDIDSIALFADIYQFSRIQGYCVPYRMFFLLSFLLSLFGFTILNFIMVNVYLCSYMCCLKFFGEKVIQNLTKKLICLQR